MTWVHRLPAGVPGGTSRVRPAVVVNDPALSASQPVEGLAASSANALAHAVVSLVNTTSTPIVRAVAREAIARFEAAWSTAEPDRPSLALLREGVGRFARSHPPTPTAQDEQAATWAPEPTGRQLSVDWSWPTARVLSRIRAISPVPGLAVEVGELRFFVTRAKPASDFVRALEPGEAAVMGQPGTLVIRTGDGAIAVERALLDQSDDDETEDDDSSGEASELDRHTLAEAVAQRVGRAVSA